MKKILLTSLIVLLTVTARAGYDDKMFKTEVREGLDVVTAINTPMPVKETPVIGELGYDVYGKMGPIDPSYDIFIPADTYMRFGAGLPIGKMSGSANLSRVSGGDVVQLGMGWNILSYVRGELDFQTQTLEFSKFDEGSVNMNGFGATLYFDLTKRYIRTGDVTKRRTFIPFIGFGVSGGNYKFNDVGILDGASGMFIAPRGTLGFTFMLNDLLGFDLAYQYSHVISNAWGWGPNAYGKGAGLSNIIGTFRYNF